MLKSPTHNEMLKHLEKWREKEATLSDFHHQIDMQSDFILDLCKDVPYNKNIAKSRKLFHDLEYSRQDNICTYRDKQYTSPITGTAAVPDHSTWANAFDVSLDAFVN